MGFVNNKNGGLSMEDGRIFLEWYGLPEVGIEYYFSTVTGIGMVLSFTSKLKSIQLWKHNTLNNERYECIFENGIKISLDSVAGSHVGFYASKYAVGKHQGNWSL